MRAYKHDFQFAILVGFGQGVGWGEAPARGLLPARK